MGKNSYNKTNCKKFSLAMHVLSMPPTTTGQKSLGDLSRVTGNRQMAMAPTKMQKSISMLAKARKKSRMFLAHSSRNT